MKSDEAGEDISMNQRVLTAMSWIVACQFKDGESIAGIARRYNLAPLDVEHLIRRRMMVVKM